MTDVVGLVPGFFGFQNGYWGPRFRDQLEHALSSRGHTSVHVEPLGTSPIGSLATRQKKLRKRLAKHQDGHATKVRWHLVGHSTGGLDAALLLADRELELVRGAGSRYSTR